MQFVHTAGYNKLILLVLGLGLLLLSTGSIIKASQSLPISTAGVMPVKLETTNAQWPKHIEIKRIGLSTQVIEGGITNGKWILSDQYAHYVPTAGKVNEGFNTIVYAHKRDNLFGQLDASEIGDEIIVTNVAGAQYSYRVVSKETIVPTNLQALYAPEANVLTLVTCDGIGDTKRLVVKAGLVQ